ncbi:HmuY family protein, partial [Mesonia mobilis]|uniref:HmuY family protein n=1 Tax=Mesonia mobilis TaxID=369791 RepID=UPI0026EFA584
GTLLIGPIWVTAAVITLASLSFLLKKKKRPGIPLLLFIVATCIGLSFSVNYIFNNIFYVIEDPEGNLYKLRFTAMMNQNGVRGYPSFEYSLLN